MKEKRKLDSHKLHWQWYRDFFSVGIFRYFVLWFSLVPLLVHFIDTLPTLVVAKWGSAYLVLRPSLPFNWVLLWLASLCYTAALVVFIVRCPDFIKKYPTFAHYKEHLHSSRWVIWLLRDVLEDGGQSREKVLNRLTSKGYADPLSGWTDAVRSLDVRPDGTFVRFDTDEGERQVSLPVLDGGNVDSEQTEVREREIFWEVFGAQAGSRPLSRIAVVTMLALALILFVVVVIQHISAAVPYVVSAVAELLAPLAAFIDFSP